jgi:fructose-1,6-bisphosphatase/inositol monophosphatase family enzyme
MQKISFCQFPGIIIHYYHYEEKLQCRNGEPVLGAIHMPVLGQLLIGDGNRTTLS